MKVATYIISLALLGWCGCSPPTAADQVISIFGETGLGQGQFSYPRGIAVSPVDGCVFVVDKSARVQRFSADGEYQAGWQMPAYENGKPTGLYIDKENRVWVPDTHYARVIVYSRDGQELFRFGETGRDEGKFLLPTDIEIDVKGNIYVAEFGDGTNDRIQKFSPDLKLIKAFANSGEGGTSRPNSLLFDDHGVMWVCDSCQHRICRYDQDGKFLGAFGQIGEAPGQLMYPYDLAWDADGHLLVADRANNRIVRYNRDGKYLGHWGSPGRGPGQLGNPWGVAVAQDGRIYCLDSYNDRVQIIDW